MASIERRIATGRVALRASAGNGQPSVISGLGAVYNSETIIGGWFRERIAPGAFASVIGPTSDVRSLFNHDPNQVLGRSLAGTLRLRDSDEGLLYDVDVNPDDPEACSTAAKIARGDVSGSSFGFRVAPGGDIWDESDPKMLPLRTITAFELLQDIGPVTYPAYEDATSEARDTARAIVARRMAATESTASDAEPRAMTSAEGEEAAELIQYQTARAALTGVSATLASATSVLDALIASETESPTETDEAEAAEEELETAQLRSLLVLCSQICGAVSGVSALAQAMLYDEFDPILYTRSGASSTREADEDRSRRLRLARARL